MRNQIYVVPFCLMFLWNSLPAQHSDAVVKLSEWEASKGAHETNTLVQITGKAILKQRGQEKSQSQGTFRIVTIRGNAHAKIELGAAGGLQVGVNEKITYEWSPAEGVRLIKGAEAMAMQRVFALLTRRSWRQSYQAAAFVPVSDPAGDPASGPPVDVLQMMAIGGGVDTWHMDLSGNELLRVKLQIGEQGGKQVECQIDFSDWRQKSGPWFPYRIDVQVADRTISLLVEQGGPASLTDNPFVLPAPVVAELEAEAKRIAAEASAKEGKEGDGPAKEEVVEAEPDSPEFQLETRAEQLTASVKTTVKQDEVVQTVRRLVADVDAHLKKVAAKDIGASFSRVVKKDDGQVEVEAGRIVETAIAAAGPVQPGTLPGGRLVTGMHRGDHQTLTQAYLALAAYLTAQKLTAEGSPFEVYETGPAEGQNKANLRTRIFQKVK